MYHDYFRTIFIFEKSKINGRYLYNNEDTPQAIKNEAKLTNIHIIQSQVAHSVLL